MENFISCPQSHLDAIIHAMPAALIVIDHDNIVTEWNPGAESAFGLSREATVGKALPDCGVPWEGRNALWHIPDILTSSQPLHFDNVVFTKPDRQAGIMEVNVIPVFSGSEQASEYLLIGLDRTEQKKYETHLFPAQKLEAIGQLASGIAHEINTPIQYLGDNLQFIQDALADVFTLLEQYHSLWDECRRQCPHSPQSLARLVAQHAKTNPEYLTAEIPRAVSESLEGIARVTAIVKAMKSLAHTDNRQEKMPADINEGIRNTITVSRNEWKYVAEVQTDLDPSLPLVTCLPGEINQVILNLIVNAAHAILEAANRQPAAQGLITVSTRQENGFVEIRVSDTGGGIPEAVRDKIFTPFFTTKPLGRGTGQGLAIARAVVVDKHQGTLTFESEIGRGTTFIVRLPILTTTEALP